MAISSAIHLNIMLKRLQAVTWVLLGPCPYPNLANQPDSQKPWKIRAYIINGLCRDYTCATMVCMRPLLDAAGSACRRTCPAAPPPTKALLWSAFAITAVMFLTTTLQARYRGYSSGAFHNSYSDVCLIPCQGTLRITLARVNSMSMAVTFHRVSWKSGIVS